MQKAYLFLSDRLDCKGLFSLEVSVPATSMLCLCFCSPKPLNLFKQSFKEISRTCSHVLESCHIQAAASEKSWCLTYTCIIKSSLKGFWKKKYKMQFMRLISIRTPVIQTMTSCLFASINRKMVVIMLPSAAVLESFDHLGCSKVSGYPRSTSKRKATAGRNCASLSIRMPAHKQSTSKCTKTFVRGKEMAERP